MMSWTTLEELVDSVPTSDLGIRADSSYCTHTHKHYESIQTIIGVKPDAYIMR